MRKIVIVLVLLVFSCDKEDASDCFQTSGTIIQQVVTTANFERLRVNRDVSVVIKEAPQHKVTIETGENLINDVSVEVIGNQLIVSDNNTCNYVRDYGITKIYIETPNLIEIRCSTQFDISSDGILNFNTLTLNSEDFNFPDTYPIGDFRLQLNSQNLNITSNNLSFFYLSGNVQNLNVNFVAGDGRVEAENLIAQDVTVFHRGTNDIVVNSQLSLSGELRSTGDLISVNQPTTVNVQEFFSGRLIFN